MLFPVMAAAAALLGFVLQVDLGLLWSVGPFIISVILVVMTAADLMQRGRRSRRVRKGSAAGVAPEWAPGPSVILVPVPVTAAARRGGSCGGGSGCGGGGGSSCGGGGGGGGGE